MTTQRCYISFDSEILLEGDFVSASEEESDDRLVTETSGPLIQRVPSRFFALGEVKILGDCIE